MLPHEVYLDIGWDMLVGQSCGRECANSRACCLLMF